jgi:hypothetical protein
MIHRLPVQSSTTPSMVGKPSKGFLVQRLIFIPFSPKNNLKKNFISQLYHIFFKQNEG